MKKLFTLAAAVLFATSIFAASETVVKFVGETGNTGIFLLGSDKISFTTVKIHTNTDAVKSVKMAATYKYSDRYYLAIKPESGTFKEGDTLKIAVCHSHDDDGKLAKAAIYAADGATKLYTTADGVNAKKVADDPVLEKYILAADADSLLIGRDGNTNTFITTLEIVRPDQNAPRASITKEAIDLKIGRTGLESKKDSFELKAANLPNDGAHTLTFPTHGGLTIEPTSFAISEGAINQKFYVTYAPTAETDDFSGKIEIAAGSFNFEIALACNKQVPYELVEISADTVWDFANAAAADVAAPFSSEILFANASEDWKEGFAAKSLIASGAQYLNYASYKCYQGKVLKFKTTVPGKLTIEFSNTGSKSVARNLFVNGVDTQKGSKDNSKISAENIAVEAGEVVIEGMEMLETPAQNMLRIYKVTFTATSGETPEPEKSHVATISEVKINNVDVTEKDGVFAYEVAADADLAKVVVTYKLADKATVGDADKSGFEIEVPAAGAAAATKKITVTAEDGTTKKEYTFSVTKAKAAEGGEEGGQGEGGDEGGDDQAVDNIDAATPATKVLRNGMLLIEKNGTTYNVQGQLVR